MNRSVRGVSRAWTTTKSLPAKTSSSSAARRTPCRASTARGAEAVAELQLGLMLAEARNIARADAGVKSGRWRKDFPSPRNCATPCPEPRRSGCTSHRFGGELLAAAPNLKLIAVARSGLENVAVAAATAAGVGVVPTLGRIRPGRRQ